MIFLDGCEPFHTFAQNIDWWYMLECHGSHPSRSPDIVLRESKLWPVFIVCAKKSTTYDMTSPFTNYTKHRLWVLVKTAYMRQF